MNVRPFNPSPGTNQLITTSGASQALVVSSVDKCVRIVNYGATNAAHVRVATGACTAADMVLGPADSIIIYKGEGVTNVTVLQITGTTTLAVSTGNDGV